MKRQFAYADPPYFGCASFYSDHPDHAKWDSLDAHAELIDSLGSYDGWALSLTSGNLHDLLPLCPRDARVAAWVKPWASFKPNVNPAYAWEPVIFVNGRKRSRDELTVRDWTSHPITLRRGLTGTKPLGFCLWVLDLIGYESGDTLNDLFPGTGIMSDAVAFAAQRLPFANVTGGRP